MRKRLFLALSFVFLLLPVGIVLAQDDSARQVADETISDDVTLVNEDLNVTETGRINGSVAIVNGDAFIAGTLNQDLIVFNGDITLAETAVIRGECVTLNGTISGGGSFETSCQEINEIPFADNFLDSPNVPPLPDFPITASAGRWIASISLSLFMGLMATGVYAFAPTPTQRIEEAMREKPFASAAVGFLSFGAIPFLNILLLIISIPLLFVCIGILGFPLVLALTLGFIAAGFWTWILWGKMLGNWITTRLNWEPNHTIVVALGTAVLTFALIFMAFSGPGWAVAVLLLSILPLAWGMGATALTRFGTRDYPVLELATPPMKNKVLAVLDTLPDEPGA